MFHDIVLFDANVLYSAPMRDLVMELALTDLFHAKWTDDIHREWIEALHRTKPDIRIEKLQALR